MKDVKMVNNNNKPKFSVMVVNFDNLFVYYFRLYKETSDGYTKTNKISKTDLIHYFDEDGRYLGMKNVVKIKKKIQPPNR